MAIKEKEQTLEVESGQNFVISVDGDRILFLDDVDEKLVDSDVYRYGIYYDEESGKIYYMTDFR